MTTIVIKSHPKGTTSSTKQNASNTQTIPQNGVVSHLNHIAHTTFSSSSSSSGTSSSSSSSKGNVYQASKKENDEKKEEKKRIEEKKSLSTKSLITKTPLPYSDFPLSMQAAEPLEDDLEISNEDIEKRLQMYGYSPKDIKNEKFDQQHPHPLLHFSLLGQLRVVEYLTDKCLDTDVDDVVDSFGTTALMCASKIGHERIVKHLIEEEDADPNIRDNYGNTALMWASANGKGSVVEYLINAKADLDVQDKKYCNSAVMRAIMNGKTEIVKKLVNAKAKLEFKNFKGKAALHLAIFHIDTMKSLINGGADKEARDRNGCTPLLLACRAGTRAMKKLSSDINEQSVEKRANIEAMKVLLEAKANKEARDRSGYTSLMLTTMDEEAEAMELLIKSGAEIEAKDKQGRTPLMLAILNGKIKAMKLLIDKGANVNAKDNQGDTPLIHASNVENENALKVLIEAIIKSDKTRLNEANNEGNTALIIASNKGNLAIVKNLLEKGADQSIKNIQGKPVLMTADSKVKEYLTRYNKEAKQKESNQNNGNNVPHNPKPSSCRTS